MSNVEFCLLTPKQTSRSRAYHFSLGCSFIKRYVKTDPGRLEVHRLDKRAGIPRIRACGSCANFLCARCQKPSPYAPHDHPDPKRSYEHHAVLSAEDEVRFLREQEAHAKN